MCVVRVRDVRERAEGRDESVRDGGVGGEPARGAPGATPRKFVVYRDLSACRAFNSGEKN